MGRRAQPDETAERLIPHRADLDDLRSAAEGCTACPLYKQATQTVFGEGSAHARLVIVGEQPGDAEDRAGRPFVGPAGRLLDAALERAGIDRQLAYVTNVVKHFKWEPRGKVRLHKTPNGREIAACRPWLEHELAVIRPKALLLLGATAAKALLGSAFRVSVQRGQLLDEVPLAPLVMATVHPSSILRERDADARHRAEAAFVADLRTLGRALERTTLDRGAHDAHPR